MNFYIPVNEYTIGIAIVLAFVAYATLLHFWPTLKPKIAAMLPRISRELDREASDLDGFVAKAHERIDAQIIALQNKKKRISDAAEVVKKISG